MSDEVDVYDDESAPLTVEARAKIKKEFIVNRQGKEFILYAGLLDAVHQEGLSFVDTNIVQYANESNAWTTIVKAVAITSRGTFSGIGDANPENVGRMIILHAIRMAETRAKGRAFRDAINVGTASVEELGHIERSNAPQRREPAQQPARQAQRPAVPPMTDAQRRQIALLQRAIGTTDRVEEMTEERAQIHIDDMLRVQASQQAKAAAKAAAKPAPGELGDTDAAPLKWVEQARALATELINEGGTAPAIPNNVTVGKLRAIKKTIDENMALIKANRPPVSARGSVVGALP